MRCCVPFCKNTEENVCKSKWITFHEFPTNLHLRIAWLTAIGKQDIPQSALVCSEHFLNDDIYETGNGLKRIRTSAIPSAVQVCTICLDIDSKLLSMSKYKLETAYENLTGYSVRDIGNLNRTLCIECAQRLLNFSKFRDKSLRAHSMMMDLVNKHDLVTIRHIKSLNRVKNRLNSNIVKTMFEPNNCDLYIYEYPDIDKKTKLDETEEKVCETATGKSSMLIDEDDTIIKLDMINENGYDIDIGSDDFVKSDQECIAVDDVKLETKLASDAVCEASKKSSICEENATESQESLKIEDLIFECTVCFETFSDENEYNGHTLTHFTQHSESDSDVCNAHLNSPPLLLTNTPKPPRSTGCDYSLITNSQRVQTPSGDSPAPDAVAIVAPLIQRHTTNDENPAYQTEKAAENEDNKQKFEVDNDELNKSIDNHNLETINGNFKVTKKAIPKSNNFLTKKRKLASACESNSPANDNISKDQINYQEINRNEVPVTVHNEMVTKPCIILLDKLTLRETQSGIVCLNYDVSKESIMSPANKSRTDEFTKTRQFSCALCQSVFKRKSNLIKHIKGHIDGSPFICKICKIECDHYSSLVSHMETHIGEKSHLVRHMRTHTVEKPFACKLCDYRATRNSYLVNHIRTHTGEKPFTCKICDFRSSRNFTLVNHMRTHTGEKPFTCKLCDYKSSLKCHLVSHIRTHTGEKPFACKLCDYRATRNCYLVNHIRTHTGEKPFSCKICDFRSSRNYSLVNHMRNHTEEKPFTCKICDYRSSQSSSLVYHMRTHTGVKPFTCKICDFRSSRNCSLVNHMRTHTGEKPFTCKFCDYKCSLKSNLVVHMRSHTGEKPFACKLCDYKCSLSSVLTRHMRSHTGEKRFTCKLCDYKCSRNSYLVKHTRIHTEEKPFTCKLCDYKCSLKCNLVVHMRSHTGEKSFTCKLCDFKCSLSSLLIRHMRSHTGGKIFTCKLCDYKCSRNSYLVGHMRSHTGEKSFTCKLCGFKCSLKSTLVIHMKTHAREKLFKCQICDYKCTLNSSLGGHMRIHTGEKPFSCKLCEYKSSHKNTLTRHMRAHVGVKPFSCDLCGHKFGRKDHLVKHIKTHTKAESS